MSQQTKTTTAADRVEVEKGLFMNGQGTQEEPFLVEFQKNDPDNPMNWSKPRKWLITAIVTLSVFSVTFASSAYSESANEIIQEFYISSEVFIAGVSLFVLGFAIGPAGWGPLVYFTCLSLPMLERSEIYGRQVVWTTSHVAMVAFVGGSAGSRNITTLLVLRFFSGIFGSAPLVNSGGAIADLFALDQRGLAMTLYCVAPFLGPLLGPAVGGFVSENVGWRWVQGVCCILIGGIGVLGIILVPETYRPVLLGRRAKHLSKEDGKVYISVLEVSQGKKKPAEVFKRALTRPWVLLFREPIVLVASVYIAIIYGTVYMFMGAMPIVYNQGRGWSDGIGGLAFLGIVVGVLLGLVYAVYDDKKRYTTLFMSEAATPESRLPPSIVGAIALSAGMFAFAWTNYPDIHWSVSIILSAPFGSGCVLVILPVVNYLIDSYTIYAASVLAANAIFRCIVGAAFPLFTAQMYGSLGIHWASSIPAFLTLACLPFPLVMYRYGGVLRMKCTYAAEAAEMMRQLQTKD
ncbi:putative Major facilitator superfamily (MFS) profile domain-containing protein [Seiridium unicorne]|uniref:Major facilitator superfamily (MFS) profile domain-containing protein n=1 Tax=Seiridium unicorne TaxID=138068 RepID=A0ABR2VBP5_9PEZI